MPIPEFLPRIEPKQIPKGMVFLGITTTDPALPMFITGWQTEMRESADGPLRPNPVTETSVREFYARSNFEQDFNGAKLKSWRIISYDDIPKDRTYRDAWEDVGGRVAHNINKAREIHRGHIRVARLAKMQELDVAYQRADEEGDQDKKRLVSATKQRLRDLPTDPAIDAAQTIDDLKQIWPDDLLVSEGFTIKQTVGR